MTRSVDIDRLASILKQAAAAEILPRFRRLEPDDIRRKTSAIDLVTEADEAAERFIRAECATLWPQATFVGEESVAADPDLLAAVPEADMAIVVDPIDGTANFAAGAPVFAVMASVVVKGETVAGLIYDPLGDDVMLAERGAGALLKRADGSSAKIAVAEAVPLGDMVGAVSLTYFQPDDKRDLFGRLSQVRVVANYRCAGHEWRLAASGHLHFLAYQKLMPWDHLAGALIYSEAGGLVLRLDGGPYLPQHTSGGLIAAPDRESWLVLRREVFGDLKPV
ncbi:inositol monophosphatase family protein [Consotaella aegiceratis]|uniref:inositol monophosphatase family protein n=1 Tax=Consotaella aegiceratis TaxID=3097961 RepID=UPI002F3E3EC8